MIVKPEHKEILEGVLELFGTRTAENIESHRNEFDDEIEMLILLKTYYLLLSSSLNEINESESFKGRMYISKQYLNVISNNFHVLKSLFEQGFHIQLQIIFRSQFEYINALIAYIGDDDYFKKYGKEQKDSNNILTPKPINTEKSIRKIMKCHNPQMFKDFWTAYKEITSYIYTSLSPTVHGNLISVALQSFEGVKNEDELTSTNICGVKYPLKVTIQMVRQMLQYFQITRGMLFMLLSEKNMLDKDNIIFEFIDYYAKRFVIMQKN